jgi:hypothetical protein
VEGYAMPQITLVGLIAFAVVLCGSVVAASAKNQFPTGGNKPMPTISCKQVCMSGFDQCRKKVIGKDKENVCCTANQNRAIKACLKALFKCEYACPSGDPYKNIPVPKTE